MREWIGAVPDAVWVAVITGTILVVQQALQSRREDRREKERRKEAADERERDRAHEMKRIAAEAKTEAASRRREREAQLQDAWRDERKRAYFEAVEIFALFEEALGRKDLDLGELNAVVERSSEFRRSLSRLAVIGSAAGYDAANKALDASMDAVKAVLAQLLFDPEGGPVKTVTVSEAIRKMRFSHGFHASTIRLELGTLDKMDFAHYGLLKEGKLQVPPDLMTDGKLEIPNGFLEDGELDRLSRFVKAGGESDVTLDPSAGRE